MALDFAHSLIKRQIGGDGYGSYNPDGSDNSDYGGWWWSPTGMAVRYSITLVLLALILLYFVGGYLHARQRVRKGLAPLPYHRWMVRRYTPQPHGYQAPGPRGSAPESYDMHVYPPPPPAYNHNEAPPPVYQPPEGASKALADQNFQHGQTHRAAGGEEATSSEAVQAPPATRS